MALKLELGALPVLPRVNPRLFRHLCAVAALVFIAYFTARTVLFLLTPSIDPTPLPSGSGERHTVRSAVQQPRTLASYEQIVNVNIFGGDAWGTVREEIDLESIPLALDSLRLRLVGTVVGGDVRANIAFIEDLQAKSQEMYREGDQVKNVTVKRILRNSVVINTGKRDEVLTMETPPAGESRPRTASARPGIPPRRGIDMAESMSMDRDTVESSLGDLTQLMQDAQIETYLEEGRPSGFRFTNIRPDSFYSRLGLRDNDVILGINGQELNDPAQFLSLKESLGGATGVALTIKREGTEQVLQYEFSE
jgi:general secretion pathway protein C